MSLSDWIKKSSGVDAWLAVIAAVGCLLGAAAFVTLGWTLGSSYAEKAFQMDLDRSAEVLKAHATKTAEAQGRVNELTEQLKSKQALRAQEKAGTNDQITRATTVPYRCLSPASARVLRSAIDRANERLAQTRSPGIATATATPTTPVATDAAEAAEDGTGVSERDAGIWAAGTIYDYESLSERLMALQRIIQADPNIVIVKGQ